MSSSGSLRPPPTPDLLTRTANELGKVVGGVNAAMLSNVVDMSAALAAMAEAGEPVTPDLVAALSPYGREHIRRFGQYVLDMEDLPPPLDPRPLPFAPAL